MPTLFVVLLGGQAKGCNTELHDVVFTTGNNLEETYPKLINKWFGIPKRLHVDSSIELKFVDNHEIILTKEKPNNHNKKLFFVNFGGYKKNYFGEIHESHFYVAATKSDALARAKTELGLSLLESHCDDNLSIDEIIAVKEVDQYFISLQPSLRPATLQIDSYYRRLDFPDILEKARTFASLDRELS